MEFRRCVELNGRTIIKYHLFKSLKMLFRWCQFQGNSLFSFEGKFFIGVPSRSKSSEYNEDRCQWPMKWKRESFRVFDGSRRLEEKCLLFQRKELAEKGVGKRTILAERVELPLNLNPRRRSRSDFGRDRNHRISQVVNILETWRIGFNRRRLGSLMYSWM